MSQIADVHAASVMSSVVAPHVERPKWIWRSGRLVPWNEALIHVNAVGHASVAAVFEGIKAYLAYDESKLLVFRLEDHLRRLQASARICRLNLPYDLDEVRAAVCELLCGNGALTDLYLRPWAFPAGIVQEHMVPADVECELVVDCWPFTSALEGDRGCRAAVSSWLKVSDVAMPPRVKAFSNYHNARMAMLEARENGHDWPILLTDRHKISEGAGACIALVRDGMVITPTVTSSLLESITRATALTLLQEIGVETVERDVDRSELYIADEVFFMGTGWEILPVTTVDGLQVGDGRPGPITERLQRRYARLVRGESGDHHEWLTEVTIPA
jgi:branched-chain amino acid aminotransferase